MSEKIKLKPGYDPDKYRDELCEIYNREQGSMTDHEYMVFRNERVRNSPFFKGHTFIDTENRQKKVENKQATTVSDAI